MTKITQNMMNINLTKYSFDKGITLQDLQENKITGEINIQDNSKGFSYNDKIAIRVYWEWNEDINVDDNTFTNIAEQGINVTLTVKQKVA